MGGRYVTAAVGLAVALSACHDTEPARVEMVLDREPESKFSSPRRMEGVGFTYRAGRPPEDGIGAARGRRMFFGELALDGGRAIILEVALPEPGQPALLRYREVQQGALVAISEPRELRLEPSARGYRFELDLETNDGPRRITEGRIWVEEGDVETHPVAEGRTHSGGCGGPDPDRRRRPSTSGDLVIVLPSDPPVRPDPDPWRPRPPSGGSSDHDPHDPGCGGHDGDDDVDASGCGGDDPGDDVDVSGCGGDDPGDDHGGHVEGCAGDDHHHDGCAGDDSGGDDGCPSDDETYGRRGGPRAVLASLWTRFGPIVLVGLVNRSGRGLGRSRRCPRNENRGQECDNPESRS